MLGNVLLSAFVWPLLARKFDLAAKKTLAVLGKGNGLGEGAGHLKGNRSTTLASDGV